MKPDEEIDGSRYNADIMHQIFDVKICFGNLLTIWTGGKNEHNFLFSKPLVESTYNAL